VGGRDRGRSALLRDCIRRTRVGFEMRSGQVREAGGPWRGVPITEWVEAEVVEEEVAVVRFRSL